MTKYYSCEEIAERYQVQVGTVWRWIRNKKIPAIQIGKQYLINGDDLRDLEEASRTMKD